MEKGEKGEKGDLGKGENDGNRDLGRQRETEEKRVGGASRGKRMLSFPPFPLSPFPLSPNKSQKYKPELELLTHLVRESDDLEAFT